MEDFVVDVVTTVETGNAALWVYDVAALAGAASYLLLGWRGPTMLAVALAVFWPGNAVYLAAGAAGILAAVACLCARRVLPHGLRPLTGQEGRAGAVATITGMVAIRAVVVAVAVKVVLLLLPSIVAIVVGVIMMPWLVFSAWDAARRY